MRTSLVVDALQMAIDAGLIAPDAIFHSDRGAQYTSREFTQFCKDNRVRTSLGRTGVCWDNAAAEAFFAALKNEMYYRQHLAHPSPSEIRRRRIHRGLLQPPPAALHPRLPHPTRSPHRPPPSSHRCLINKPRNCPRSLTQPSASFGGLRALCRVACSLERRSAGDRMDFATA